MLENTALFQAYPLHVDRPLYTSGMVFSMAPWGTVTFAGIRGKDEQQVDQIILGYEWAIPLWPGKVAFSKEEKEEFHLSRFCTDYVLACGREYCSTSTLGQNPPDFVCVREHESVNVDCAQFTLAERRKALQMFEALRHRVLESKARFTNLRGFIIYVWFGWVEDYSVSLPHHPTQEPAIDSLLDALAHCVPNPNRLLVPSGSLPAQAPDLGLIKTEHGAFFYVVPLTSGVPATDFFARQGFELGLAFTSRHDREAVWAELQRIIGKHDKAEIDNLIISSGAPNEKGLVYPTEDLIVEFALEREIQLVLPTHLSAIYLHVWSTGVIVQIWPHHQRMSRLFPGGFGPSWHNARPG
jgi:hypothetical protein